jgi:hypothetical protein
VDRLSAPLYGYLCHGGRGDPLVTALTTSAGGSLVDASDGFRDGDAIVWGILRGTPEIMREARSRGRHFHHMDHPYLARGGEVVRYRISRDELQNTAPPAERPANRWERLGLSLADWSVGGRTVLISPPGPAVRNFYGDEAERWLSDTLATLARHTDRPLVVREKPPGFVATDLGQAFQDVHAVVTYVSNMAVDAVLAGIPVFVDPKSSARWVGHTDLSAIETPRYPDRLPWLRHLASCQFTVEEMANGFAWSVLQEAELPAEVGT